MKSQEEKRREGEERTARWESMTPVEQLQDLDRRFGKGVGATRQRKRLLALIDSELQEQVVELGKTFEAIDQQTTKKKKFKKGTKQRA